MKSAAVRRIDVAISLGAAPWLRSMGYRRTGRSFTRPVESVFQCVHFQASQFNSPESGRFTANVTVVWPPWHRAWTGATLHKNAAMATPLIESRLKQLETGLDYWWILEHDGQIDFVAAELRAVAGVARSAVPGRMVRTREATEVSRQRSKTITSGGSST